MELVIILIVVGGVVLFVRQRSESQRRVELERRTRDELEAARGVADEDVTRFGEELQRLDSEMLTASLDEATRQDYERALSSYEAAKESLERSHAAADMRHVTEALEDGRYAVACVRARANGDPLPTRRPPCFFNPAHGPSTTDIDWAPPGGQPRQVPVCAADADRVQQGAEPDIRTVPQGAGRVPYWQGGPAYSPWASGYFGGYAGSGLLPAFMMMTLLSPGWDGMAVDGFDTRGYEDSGNDGGDGGDGGADGGGYDGGSDGGYDGGGSDGGFDGGGDGGGWDIGGGDFGGGDFGGF
jgi:hypothetical protein